MFMALRFWLPRGSPMVTAWCPPKAIRTILSWRPFRRVFSPRLSPKAVVLTSITLLHPNRPVERPSLFGNLGAAEVGSGPWQGPFFSFRHMAENPEVET